VGIGQLVFVYNLFRTLGRQPTKEEEQFSKSQQDRAQSEAIQALHRGGKAETAT
jgi:hypothetical protein